MECNTIINSIGLISDIVGGLLIFKYGFPPALEKIRKMDVHLNDLITSPEKIKEDNKYLFWNKVGIILILIGFALQLVSNFIK